MRGLRDSSKCARLLAKLKNLRVYVAAVQENHFICAADCRVLENDFNVFSTYDSRSSPGVSLLVGRSFDTDADVVFASDGGRLVVADVAVKSFMFRLVVVYALSTAVERFSFFRRLVPFLDDSKQLVLIGDRNAILGPRIDKVGRGVSRLGRCESITCHDLVDRFRLDRAGREKWTWLDSYMKSNTSLLEIRDFRDRLESLIKRVLVGEVTGIGDGFLLNIGLEISSLSTVVSST